MLEGFNKNYLTQVRLLLEVLPLALTSEKFALKGGTAINLFLRDLPRLSVDIDLTYLPISSRIESIADINVLLAQISRDILNSIPKAKVRSTHPLSSQKETKLIVELDGSTVKIEPNYILRGRVFPSVKVALSESVVQNFNVFLSGNLLSKEDVYAGKICAALDRQHPRDLFDIHILLENEGLTEGIRKAFLVYLMSHNRPMSELLSPNWQNLTKIFATEFSGMSRIPVTMGTLQDAGRRLIQILMADLKPHEKDFLFAF